MRNSLLLILLAALSAAAQSTPFPNGETVSYTANWPSGLALGEGQIIARQTPSGVWNFEFTLDASIPGFAVKDQFRSQATANLCSDVLEKRLQHGKRKAEEEIEFDRGEGKATRFTLPKGPKGGETTIPIGSCARDALTFLFQIRRDLAAGRMPAPATVLFGAPYQVKFDYGGTQKIQGQDADRLVGTLKGPASEAKFELWFARGPLRTFLQARVPLAMGTFSLEIAH